MKRLLVPAGLATLTLLPACSSVSVRDYQHSANVAKPAHVFVAPFETNGTFQVAGAKGDTAAFRQNVAKMLNDYTVENVTRHVAPASKVASAGAAPRAGWLVKGRFTRVSTGSRGLRMLIGLGAGGSKMETSVEVIDLASNRGKPFMHFATSGGSNAMPGLVTSGGPGVGAAYSMIYQAHNGVTDDAARTSRMIAAALSEYFGERGWIARDRVFRIKRPGEFQLIHGM